MSLEFPDDLTVFRGHFFFHADHIDILSDRLGPRKQQQKAVDDPAPVGFVGEIEPALLFVEGVVGPEGEPEPAPDLVPENLASADTEKGAGPDITCFMKVERPPSPGGRSSSAGARPEGRRPLPCARVETSW